MLIVGDKEAETGTVSLRHRRQGDMGSLTIEQCLGQLLDENSVE